MPNEEQPSLFDLSTIGASAPASQLDLIPTDAKIPIPPGTYQTMTQMAEHCNRCHRCDLGNNRTHAVIGRGNLQADVMIIGEGPGQNEDETGLPFVGKAGQLLEKILASVNLSSEQDIYIANAVKCLAGSTQIFTKQGIKRLNWIVKNHWSGEVLSVDDQGHLVWKKITNWYSSKLAGRPLYQVSFKQGKSHSNDRVGYTATADHPVLTRRGWIPVEALQENDLVATGTPVPGPKGLQVLYGSLLGDGSIDFIGQFFASHSIQQEAYLKLKARVLNGFNPKLQQELVKVSNGDSYHSITMELPQTHYLGELRQEWYAQGKKDFPIAALEKLDNFGLAIWYMEAGAWRKNINGANPGQNIDVEITLGDIKPETVAQVVKSFENRGYQTYSIFQSTWKLCFKNGEGLRFLESIAAYVPASIRYKLPEELHPIPFEIEAYQEELAETHWKPIHKKQLPPKPYSYAVYCIDVEDTANFVTPAGVVHNCRPPGNRVPTPQEIAACKPYLLEQIRMVDPKIILLTGATAVKSLTGDKRGITKIRGLWMEWEGRLCMPIFHPAYLLRNQSKEQGSPKWLMWQDIQAVRAKLDEIRANK
jgi:uracil-DNA glycosylase family 4